jgi:hypothetical protein
LNLFAASEMHLDLALEREENKARKGTNRACAVAGLFL